MRKLSVGERPIEGVISMLTATGAGPVPEVENSHAAGRPVSGNQNQEPALPTGARPDSLHAPWSGAAGRLAGDGGDPAG